MQYYLNDKKLNKIEKQKAEKDGLKIFEEENKKYIDKTFLKRKLLISKLFELLDN